MIDFILLSRAVIFSSLLTLLSIGLTLTYLTTKVPNFAHGTFAALGAYVTLTAVKLWLGNPYHFLFLALLIGGIIGLAQYLIVFRPLTRRGATVVGLMITTLAIEFILLAVMNIYADYLSTQFKIRSRYFLLSYYDINIVGQKGILVVSLMLAAVTVTFLYLALTRTKFGVAMRAAIEDSSLSSVVGINVNMVYAVSWFIAGGLGGLAGALLPLWFPGNPDMGSKVIISVFAASIVGGLGSIYGAVLGGFLVGLAEILGTSALASEIGAEVIPYRPLIPLIAIAITLLLAPEGLTGVNWRGITKGIWNRTVGFMRIPSETFKSVKDENSFGQDSIRHYLKLLVAFAILQTLLFTSIPEYYVAITSFIAIFVPIVFFTHWPPLSGFIYIFIGGLIAAQGFSLLTHVWVNVLGGKKKLGQTIKSVTYGSTPLLVLGWIPFLGIAFIIWSIKVSIIGIRELHEVSTKRAVAAFILGAACFSVLVRVLILFFA
jgi:branched-chain amino acid transport system permease protein